MLIRKSYHVSWQPYYKMSNRSGEIGARVMAWNNVTCLQIFFWWYVFDARYIGKARKSSRVKFPPAPAIRHTPRWFWDLVESIK